MLEGGAELGVLKAGQFLADQLAYLRINKTLTANYLRYLRSNRVPVRELLPAIGDSLKHCLSVQKSLLAFPGTFMVRLVRGQLEDGLVSEITYWRNLHREWGGPARVVSDAKTLTRKLITSDRIPDIGYFVSGNWFDLNWQQTTPRGHRQLHAQRHGGCHQAGLF